MSSPITIIESSQPWRARHLVELWRYRHLAFLFAARDIKVRYKQTLLGFLWVVVQPLALTGVYSVIFGKVARIPSEGVPYPLFLLSGQVLWQFFVSAVNGGSTSLVTQNALISKVYFPRILVVVAPMLAALVDLAILFVLTLAAELVWHRHPGPEIVFAPCFVLLASMTVLALALWFSSLDAYFRDVRYLLGFGLQIAYFATPILYPLSIVPSGYARLYALNPMAVAIQGFRWSLLGDTAAPGVAQLAVSVTIVSIALLGGYAFFRRTEGTVVDRL